jgi:phage-related protein
VNDLLRAIKPAVFVGSSRKDLRRFPGKVRLEIGQAIFEAQLGDYPASAKPLKGYGSGVLEIRDNFDGDTYRAVYTVRLVRPSRVPKEIDQGDRHATATP